MNKTQSSFETANRRAKRLRKNSTYAEQAAWKTLRTLCGLPGRFRRQAPVGPYVVDFVCHALKLIIEIDGGVHKLADVVERDALRDAHFTAQGFQILRVPSRLATDPDALAVIVLQAIGRC